SSRARLWSRRSSRSRSGRPETGSSGASRPIAHNRHYGKLLGSSLTRSPGQPVPFGSRLVVSPWGVRQAGRGAQRPGRRLFRVVAGVRLGGSRELLGVASRSPTGAWAGGD